MLFTSLPQEIPDPANLHNAPDLLWWIIITCIVYLVLKYFHQITPYSSPNFLHIHQIHRFPDLLDPPGVKEKDHQSILVGLVDMLEV